MKLKLLAILCGFILTCCFGREKSGFEIYGDVMQILPFAMMIYSYAKDDIQGVKEQATGAGATLLLTHLIKESLVIVSHSNEAKVRFAQRPNNGSFNGFPSGHTSFVFSSVGFAQKHYGYQLSLPLAALATSVGISRIHAQKHTTTQVIAGAILGFSTSYLFASKYTPPQMSFLIDVTPNGTFYYGVSYKKIF